MKQEFKLKKEGYYKAIKRMFYFWLGFPPCFTLLMWGIFYFTGTEFQKPLDWYAVLFPLFFIMSMLSFQFLGGLSRAKTENKNYKVIFKDHAIKLEQLGSWDELINQFFFFKPNYTINHQHIPYKEIVSIQKSKNGSFIIKGQENSYPNTLILSPHIEHAKELEITLSEIKLISNYPSPSEINTEFKAKEIAWQQLFTIKNISIIVGIYLLTLVLADFWFDPINWSLTIFLTIACFLAVFGMVWSFRKMGYGIYSLTVDDARIVVVYKNGTLRAIPFNQIISIKKRSANQLVILTNQINISMANFISIPNTLENFECLEQKLNAIHPIIYTKKNRTSALASDD